jgi:hypothetical protein
MNSTHISFQTCQSVVLVRKKICFQPCDFHKMIDHISWRLARALLIFSLAHLLLSTSRTQVPCQLVFPTSDFYQQKIRRDVHLITRHEHVLYRHQTSVTYTAACRRPPIQPKQSQTRSAPTHLEQAFPESFNRHPQRKSALCRHLSAGELRQSRKGIFNPVEALSKFRLEVLLIALNLGQGGDVERV